MKTTPERGTPGELIALLGTELRVGCTLREGSHYGRQWLLQSTRGRDAKSTCVLYSGPYYAGLEHADAPRRRPLHGLGTAVRSEQ